MVGYEDYKEKIEIVNMNLLYAEQKIFLSKQSTPKNAKIKMIWIFGFITMTFIISFVAMIVVPGTNNMPETLAATGAVALIYGLYRFIINLQNRKVAEKEQEERKVHEDIYKELLVKRIKLFEEFVNNNGGKIFYSTSRDMDYGIMRENNDLILANLSFGLQLEQIDIFTIAYIEKSDSSEPSELSDGSSLRAAIVFKSGNRMEFTEKAYQFLVELFSDVDMNANRKVLSEIADTYGEVLADVNIV